MSGGFEDFGLLPELLAAVGDLGWAYVICWVQMLESWLHVHIACRLPRDVQDETIPLMMGGGDVMVVCLV